MSKKLGLLGALALATFATAGVASAEEGEVKIASLAPAGSPWAKIMAEGGKEIEKRTEGRIKIKFFFSGSQGDERDAVRKMKLGQLDGAALTAVGLGLVKSDVRVLELPYLYANDKQLDYVRGKMQPDLEKEFDNAGYVLLAWGDVGWVHLFSANQITTKAELQAAKMWAWTDDPIVREFFKRLGVNGVPLGVPDVLTALQTGTIDSCYGSPLAALALQWYTKVRFATTAHLSYSIGALVVRKEVFNKASEGDQKILRELGADMGQKLMASVRRDNERAANAMKKAGVVFVPTPPEAEAEFRKTAAEVWEALSGGKLYSSEILAKAKKYAAEAPK